MLWASLSGLASPLVAAVTLVALVLAAVHYAEVVAHKVGEPFGTLILAVSVTVIEVGLIISLMLALIPTVAILPILVLFIFAQRYFLRGIQLTGMKG